MRRGEGRFIRDSVKNWLRMFTMVARAVSEGSYILSEGLRELGRVRGCVRG